jgi:hypothetical protein
VMKLTRQCSCISDNNDNRAWTDNVRCIGTLIELAATRVFLFYSPWSTQSIIGVETGCSPAGLVERSKTIRHRRERESFFYNIVSLLIYHCRTVHYHLLSIVSLDLWSFDLKVREGQYAYFFKLLSVGQSELGSKIN